MLVQRKVELRIDSISIRISFAPIKLKLLAKLELQWNEYNFEAKFDMMELSQTFTKELVSIEKLKLELTLYSYRRKCILDRLRVFGDVYRFRGKSYRTAAHLIFREVQ